MADHITFQIVGIPETIHAIRGWGEDVQAEAKQALADEANRIASVMQSNTPVGKTGNLRRGAGQIRFDPFGFTAMIRNTAPHAHLVEWGHRIVGRKSWSYDYQTREVTSSQGRVRRQGDRTRRADPSIFVVPAMDGRGRFHARMKQILGRPIEGVATPEVRET